MDVNMILWLLGGLGLFLYGMKLMGDGLESSVGSKLKDILEKVTSNPLKAVAVGAIVTAVIQSSSATTVMVVGFVNSGLLSLVQATGIIMGANIGTTVTAFLVSIHVEAIVPVFLALGGFVVLFSKSKKRRDVATILLGFGILMLGMETMKDAMAPLSESVAFHELIVSLGSHWYLALLAGSCMTLLVQSSSATTGILIALTATGDITLQLAWPFLLGANIGTCVTALLSSLTANKTAKRAAVIHLLFNVLGALIFLPFGGLFIQAATALNPGNTAIEISILHLIFNVLNTAILLPFTRLLIRVSGAIVGQEQVPSARVLDKRLLETPAIAVGQVTQETVKIAKLARTNLAFAAEAFSQQDLTRTDEIYENEGRINRVVEEITTFLVALSGTDVDIQPMREVSNTYHVLNDIERISDHAENIYELAQELTLKEVLVTETAKTELAEIMKYCLMAIDEAIESYREGDLNRVPKVLQYERRIDELERIYRANHIERLTQGKCTPLAGILYLDLLSNLERVGDHAKNIADAVSKEAVLKEAM